MRTKVFYKNLFLIAALLIVGLAVSIKSVKAIDMQKAFWQSGSQGLATSWGVWQEGQYYRTTADATWYLLGEKGRGWAYSNGSWSLNHEEYRECWWCSNTGNMLISEWEGVSNARHYARRYYGSSQSTIYTSEDGDWDTSTCFSNVNHSSCN